MEPLGLRHPPVPVPDREPARLGARGPLAQNGYKVIDHGGREVSAQVCPVPERRIAAQPGADDPLELYKRMHGTAVPRGDLGPPHGAALVGRVVARCGMQESRVRLEAMGRARPPSPSGTTAACTPSQIRDIAAPRSAVPRAAAIRSEASSSANAPRRGCSIAGMREPIDSIQRRSRAASRSRV